MPRVKKSVKTRKRRKRVLKEAKGYRGARGHLYRGATEAVDRAHKFAYRDRKTKKRTFRSLWIIRINAAARTHDLTYNQLISGLNKAKVEIDRKVLAEMAISDPLGFSKIVEIAKGQLG
ncbi:MAG: 50S ribosomal protein L20 [Deltaproteobacteria bacterium]|jgi:large subunit ribosomal protein L20|nr:50S ribosomal protein L20 [Deltaproteobacteria bacterium]